MKKIGILGGGVWGSTLAKLLSNNEVMIYARDEKIISSINEYKINGTYAVKDVAYLGQQILLPFGSE